MAEFSVDALGILTDAKSKAIYESVRDLPIVDYHCHLTARDIYEDKPFGNIAQMWLAADHYKWRLMRTRGVDEYYITGGASEREKFDRFVETVATAFGNPIYDWVRLELHAFFGVDDPVTPENADRIWTKCNEKIAAERLSPRKTIERALVEYIATTDDPCDELAYHALLRDGGYAVKVAPSFRTDALVQFEAPDYAQYLDRLGRAAGVAIRDLDTFLQAIERRLDAFVEMGCKFSDIGTEGFPSAIGDAREAERTFLRIVEGQRADAQAYDALRGYLYVWLAKAYARRKIVMQLHVAVARNCNRAMLRACGRDSGFDCVGDPIDVARIRNVLNAANDDGLLPQTIVYTLNPTMYYPLTTLCGAFAGVRMGISWWFNDHKRGMAESLACIAELGHLLSLVGMLTDSRSFLSYTRHDYYRQIVCAFLAQNTPDGADRYALQAAYALCYGNAKAIVEDTL